MSRRTLPSAAGEPLDADVLATVRLGDEEFLLASPDVAPDLVLCWRDGAPARLVDEDAVVRRVLLAAIGGRASSTPLTVATDDGEVTVHLRFATTLDGRDHLLVAERPEAGARELVLVRDAATGALSILDDPVALARFQAHAAGLERRAALALEDLGRQLDEVSAPPGLGVGAQQAAPERPELREGHTLLAELERMLRELPAWAEGTPAHQELTTAARQLRDGLSALEALERQERGAREARA